MGPAVSEVQIPGIIRGFAGLHLLWAGFDQAARELARAVGVPLCVDGCGLCCVANTPVALQVEVLRASVYLRELEADTRNGILNRIEDWLTRPVLEVGMHPEESVLHPMLGKAEAGARVPARELSACLRGRCPLLAADLTCSVYPVRPLACRAYGVTRLADPFCKRPTGLGETGDHRLIYEGPGSSHLEILVTGLVHELRDTPHLTRWAVFPTALYAEFRPGRLVEILESIPTARLIGGEGYPSFIFESQRRFGRKHAPLALTGGLD